MIRGPKERRTGGNRPPLTRDQRLDAVEAVWRSRWPHITATIIGVIMLFFGLALAGIEAAKLDIDGNVDTTSVSISSARAKRLEIGIGVWSGALVAVAAFVIFIINCSSNVKHWAQISFAFVGAATLFCITNLAVNAKIVRIGVVNGGFNSSDPTSFRLAAAEIAAASLSFIACVSFIIMYAVVVVCLIKPIVKTIESIGFVLSQA